MLRNIFYFVTGFLLTSIIVIATQARELTTSTTALKLHLSTEQMLDILNERPQKEFEQSHSEQNIKNSNVFFIKVQHNSVLTDNWAKKMCDVSATTLSSIYGSKTQSHCFKSDIENAESIKLFNLKKSEINPDFQFELTRENTGFIKVKLINLHQKDISYANAVGWRIQDNSDFSMNLKERIADSYFAINHLNIIRDAVSELALEANHVTKNDLNKDKDLSTYDLLKNSQYWTPKTRKFILAGSEMLATLGVGWYGYHYLSDNKKDYDYNDFTKTIINKIKLGSDFRYDDNGWSTNESHVYAGVNYYLQCRGIGLTALQSYMCSIAASTAWEVLIEWREVFSINDEIFTANGGAILGESIHQLGNYIDQKAPPWFKSTIGWLWKGPKKAHQFLNSKALNGKDSDLDANDPLVTGKFEFELQTIHTSTGRNEKRVGIKNVVNLIPFSVEPGHEITLIKDLVETEFDMNAPTQDIVNQYDIFAKVVLSAYYTKNLSKDSRDRLNGYSFYVGPSAALDLKNDFSFYNDFIGVVHVLGSSAKLINYYKGFKITSSLDIWGDSVMVKSFMIEKYKDQYGSADIVHNLGQSNYYHGWGYTTRGQVIVEYGPWTTGGSLNVTDSFNTNSRQRDFGKSLNDLNLNDQTISAEVYIERIITPYLKIRLAVEKIKRRGEIIGFGSTSVTEVRNKLSIMYYF